MRPSKRSFNELRKIEFIPNYTKHAEGSCLVKFGDTIVLCTATYEEKVPFFQKGSGSGWISAEYGMLPRSTDVRNEREATKGKQSGRTMEIQRLISRSLRAAVDLQALGERQIKIDCDVLQADGGTRTASICGACVALNLALKRIKANLKVFKGFVGAVSCGILKDSQAVVDLNYEEDSMALVDANFVMDEHDRFIEVQGTGENSNFSDEQFWQLMSLAKSAIKEIIHLQKQSLKIV